MAITESAWAILWGPLLFLKSAFFGWLLPFVSIPIFFWAGAEAAAWFIASFGVRAALESWSHYVYADSQVRDAMNGVLSPKSQVDLVLLPVPDDLTSQFPGFEAKIRLAAMMKAFTKSMNWGDIDLAIHRSGPVLAFRYCYSEDAKIFDAAMAYPQQRAASLVFVRSGLDELTDAARFQLYHELGHATLDGSDIHIRPLRWRYSAFLSWIFGCISFGTIVISAFPSKIAMGATSIFLIGLALILRKQIAETAQATSKSSSEAVADAIALLHPYFQSEGRWKTRAERAMVRLCDEYEQEVDEDARSDIFGRAMWLGKHLRAGHVVPYFPFDVDPRLVPAFVLLVLAGVVAPLSPEIMSNLFLVFLCAVIASNWIVMGWSGFKSNENLIALANRINALVQNRPQPI